MPMPLRPQPVPIAPQPSRMKLAAVQSSRKDAPTRWLLYGVEGIGKSTFGAEAPSPIFISAENGLKHLDVPMFPAPTSFKDVLDAVDELTTTDHAYKTLIIDTLDWIEPLLWRDVCQKANAADIEAVGGGFQKGYIAAVDTWRVLLARLERLNETKGMEIGLLAHTTVTTFNNPNGPDYKRFQAAFHVKAYDLVKQWVDLVLFANFEDVYGPDAGKKRGQIKGVSTGKRELFTERTAAYDAKNRLGLPPMIPFSYADFAAARSGVGAPSAPDLAAECRRLSTGHPDAEKIEAFVAAHETDVKALVQCMNSLRVSTQE